jgi:hypothetical protein
MKPKPFLKTGFVIACFDGDPPRFVCKDRKHGHYVVTTDPAHALAFKDEADAHEAREAALRAFNSAWSSRQGTWRTYRMNSKTTFEEMRALVGG